MKLEVKNIKFGSEATHQETLNFTSDLYVDGKKVAQCRNQGHGGMTFIQPYKPEFRPILIQAEQYAMSLPPVKGYSLTFGMTLDFFVDEEVNKIYNEKQKNKLLKKIDKLSKEVIVFGSVENGKIFSRGYNIPIEKLKLTEKGREHIQNLVNKILLELKEGESILNKNIDEFLPKK